MVSLRLNEKSFIEVAQYDIKAGYHFHWKIDELMIQTLVVLIEMLCVNLKGHVCNGLLLYILEISQFSQIHLFSHKFILSLKSGLKCSDKALDVADVAVD